MAKNTIQNRLSNSFEETFAVKEEHDKIQELQQKIKKLDRQAEEREQLLNQLRSQLEQQSGKFSVPIDKIEPSQQCRQTFTEAVIRKRAESLLAQGQLEPLILIASTEETGLHRLEDGELTWRAASTLVEKGKIEWKNLTAVFSNLTPNDNIHRRTLIHHLHSETLTPLDRAEAVVREIVVETELDKTEVIKLLRNIDYRLRKSPTGKQLLLQIENLGIESCQQELEASEISAAGVKTLAFLRQLQINLTSFVANDLDTLLLFDDLKAAVRERGLSCRQAKILNQLQGKKLNCTEEQATKIRLDAIAEVLALQLGSVATRKLVSRLIKQHQPEDVTAESLASLESYKKTKEALNQLSLTGLKPRQLKSLKLTMEKKLSAVNNKLAEWKG